jgi:guanine deaminase
MDRMTPDYYQDKSVEEAIQSTQQCIDHIKRIDPSFDLITPVLTPRFAISCTDQALAELGRLHKETGLPVQTHISENTSEIELVRQLFPSHESYAHVYDTAGLLTSKTILAHAVHLEPSERELIKAREAKISHCPASNTALISGHAKVRNMVSEGLTIGLGTDVSGGHTPSILGSVREALMVSRHVAIATSDPSASLSVEEALYLATRSGAKVVGLEDRIGGFEVGMDWDAQMISLGSGVGDTVGLDEREGLVEIFGNETWEEKVAKWVYTGDDRNTTAVWVKGRLVHSREGFKP